MCGNEWVVRLPRRKVPMTGCTWQRGQPRWTAAVGRGFTVPLFVDWSPVSGALPEHVCVLMCVFLCVRV